MKNKKISLILAAAFCASILTACGKDTEITDNNTSGSGTAESEVTEETIIFDGTAPPNDAIQTDAPGSQSDEQEGSPLQSIVGTVTSSVEWASLDEITDDETIKEFFKLDKSNPDYKDMIVMQCPMSSVVAEIIIIEAQDGKAEDAVNALKERRQKLIDVDAFYPDSKEIAEQSITGTYHNVAYFIAGENAQQSEDILLQELENNGY